MKMILTKSIPLNFLIMQLTNRLLKKELILTAGILTIISGILHLLPAAYTHFSPCPPLETLFFIGLGLAQITWAHYFIEHPNERGYQIGLALNGGTAFFWLLTRTLPAPFQASPEHIDLLSTIIFLMQLGAVISLLFWEEITDKKHLIRNTLFAIIVMLMIGSGLYGATNAMEWVFPERSFSHAHDDGEGHEYPEVSDSNHEIEINPDHKGEVQSHDEIEEKNVPHDDDHPDDGHGH